MVHEVGGWGRWEGRGGGRRIGECYPPCGGVGLKGGGMKKVALGGLGLDVAWARCGVKSGSGLDWDDDARAVR